MINTTAPMFIKMSPFNFTPLARTPWAGQEISAIKKRYQTSNAMGLEIPSRIGESWEVSTSDEFLSLVQNSENSENSEIPKQSQNTTTLSEALAHSPEIILGKKSNSRFGSHCPILLKWIEASTPLSVQIHPNHKNPSLKKNECGKPEAWLILAAKPNASIYLGFKENLTQTEIENFLKSDNAQACLHKFEPNPFDYISIPAGCVHALGPDILVAEPQVVLPQKNGKTWRMSDWQRLYNKSGVEDPTGQPRELHSDFAISAIDWSLPRGKDLEKLLIHELKHAQTFSGNNVHPFAAQIFLQAGQFSRQPLFAGEFEIVTMWAGKATLRCPVTNQILEMKGGESALVSAQISQQQLKLESHLNEQPALAFFSLNPESNAWLS